MKENRNKMRNKIADKLNQNKNNLSKEDEKKIRAFIASFFTIIGFIIALILWKHDDYTMYYAKHGLILFIGQIILMIMNMFTMRWFMMILWIVWIIAWVTTWIYALSGNKKRIVVITDLAEKIKL